jgi:hypothetical protein
MSKSGVPALITIVMAVAVGGCSAGGGGNATPSPSPSATPPASSSSTPTPEPSVSPGAESPKPSPSFPRPPGASPKPPIGDGYPITVTGVISSGVEAGCLLIGSGNLQWLLIGGDPRILQPGAKVTVVGVPAGQSSTTCMQGKPLMVQRASRG